MKAEFEPSNATGPAETSREIVSDRQPYLPRTNPGIQSTQEFLAAARQAAATLAWINTVALPEDRILIEFPNYRRCFCFARHSELSYFFQNQMYGR